MAWIRVIDLVQMFDGMLANSGSNRDGVWTGYYLVAQARDAKLIVPRAFLIPNNAGSMGGSVGPVASEEYVELFDANVSELFEATVACVRIKYADAEELRSA